MAYRQQYGNAGARQAGEQAGWSQQPANAQYSQGPLQQQQQRPAVNASGMRPLQLRHPQQQQHLGQSATARPYNGQAPTNSRPRPNIPILQVTVPPPVHQQQQQQQHPAQPPRSAQYAHMPYTPTSPYSSDETLIESGDSHDKKAWSPYSSTTSPSIKNLQLAPPTADVVAHPENDRLSPATPGLAGQKDFWKRFSTVVRANQEQEHMAEKVGGKGAHAGAGSEWLDKQKTKERNYKFWVAGVAFLIIAGIAGGRESPTRSITRRGRADLVSSRLSLPNARKGGPECCCFAAWKEGFWS